MGKKSPPSPPPPPNPADQIGAQARALPDVRSPFGNVTYSGDPDKGNFRQTIKLSPTEQARYDAYSKVAQSMLGRSGEAISGMPASFEFTGAEDPSTNRFFMNQKALLDKTFEEDEERLHQRLANQGIPMDGEAYNRELEKFRQSKADAYEGAAAESLNLGFNQDLATRQQRYNEIAQAMGGAQLQGIPGAGQPIDVAGAFANEQAGKNAGYQGELAGYNADVGSRNAAVGSAAQLGTMYLLANSPWMAAAFA